MPSLFFLARTTYFESYMCFDTLFYLLVSGIAVDKAWINNSHISDVCENHVEIY